ncbi:MAG: hypothetical protein HY922_07150 [Elusimicrobia bacterium]|nr:hypothetical protein [Elusimicrobiota bacterium]
MKILFVCTGNSCRSVMAQYLLNKMAADRSLSDWEALSSGIAAERYFGVPAEALKALGERGVQDVQHTPRLVTRELMRWADVVLGMAAVHIDVLHDQFSEHIPKTHLFLDYAGLGERDVDDPIGQSEKVYLRARDLIEAGLEGIVKRGAHAKP